MFVFRVFDENRVKFPKSISKILNPMKFCILQGNDEMNDSFLSTDKLQQGPLRLRLPRSEFARSRTCNYYTLSRWCPYGPVDLLYSPLVGHQPPGNFIDNAQPAYCVPG